MENSGNVERIQVGFSLRVAPEEIGASAYYDGDPAVFEEIVRYPLLALRYPVLVGVRVVNQVAQGLGLPELEDPPDPPRFSN